MPRPIYISTAFTSHLLLSPLSLTALSLTHTHTHTRNSTHIRTASGDSASSATQREEGKTGIARVIEALQTTMWDEMEMKSDLRPFAGGDLMGGDMGGDMGGGMGGEWTNGFKGGGKKEGG